MFKVIIPVLLLSANFAFAQKWMAKLPSEINNAVDEVNTPKCESCNAIKSPNKYNSCLIDLCGEQPKFVSLLDQYKNKLMAFATQAPKPDPAEEEFTQKIKKYYDIQLSEDPDREKLEQKLLDEIIKIKKTGKINSTAQVAGMLTFFDGLPALQNIQVDEKTGSMHVDKSFLAKIDPKKKKRFEYLVAKLNGYLSDPLWQIRQYSPRSYLKKRYPKAKTEQEALSQYLNALADIHERIKKAMPVGIEAGIDFQLLKSKLQNNQLSQAELEMIMSEGSSLEMFDLNIDYGNKFQNEIVQEVSKEINGWIKDHDEEEIVTQVKAKIFETSGDKTKLTADKKAALEGCLEIYRRNMAMLPGNAQIDKLSKVIANSKTEFVAGLDKFPGLSAPSKKEIAEDVEDIVFEPPFSAEKLKEIFFDNLNHKIKTEENRDAFFNEKNMEDYVPFFTFFTMHPELSNDEEEKQEGEPEPPGEILELCQKLEQAPFSDATYTAFGNIALSYTLAQGPEYYQKGVIYHEIAHNLERLFNESKKLSAHSKISYAKTKTCLTGIHTYLGTGPTDKFYSEDFADFVAMKILPANTTSPDCEYMSFSQETKEYDSASLKNEAEDDTHSSLLFRALRATLDSTGSVPASCIETLKNDGVSNFPEGCGF